MKRNKKFDTPARERQLQKEFLVSGYKNFDQYKKDVKNLFDKGLTLKQAMNRVKLNKADIYKNKEIKKFLTKKDVINRIKGANQGIPLNTSYDPIKAAAANIRKSMERENIDVHTAIKRFKRSQEYGTTRSEAYRMNVADIYNKITGKNIDYINIKYKDDSYELPDGTIVKFETPDGDSHAHIFINGVDQGLATDFGIYFWR